MNMKSISEPLTTLVLRGLEILKNDRNGKI